MFPPYDDDIFEQKRKVMADTWCEDKKGNNEIVYGLTLFC